MQSVEAFRQAQDPETLALIDALRAIIASAHENLEERIKWNAPSFAIDGDDRITLGIERKGGVRIVFHRGAKAKDASGFCFDDPSDLAKWPAPDRGVAFFRREGEIDTKRDAIIDLCRRWIDQTA